MPCSTTWAHSCSAVALLMRTMSTPKCFHKQSHGCSCQGSKATNHTLRNPLEVASGTHTSTHLILVHTPEPSGNCLRNLHQHTPEPSGTFRDLPPEPTPAHTGTLRNLPEPASGTFSCDPHRNTPELIWAEDPFSSCCWEKLRYFKFINMHPNQIFFTSLHPEKKKKKNPKSQKSEPQKPHGKNLTQFFVCPSSKSTASTLSWAIHTRQAWSCASWRPSCRRSRRREWPVITGEGLRTKIGKVGGGNKKSMGFWRSTEKSL